MRTISLVGRQSLNAEQTGVFPIFLLTINHESFEEPKRFSTDPTQRLSTDPLVYGTISREMEFYFLPIGLILPDDTDDAAPVFRLTMDNIIREMIPALRSFTTPASVDIELVWSSDTDTVDVVWPEFDLTVADYSAGDVTVDLVIDALSTEPYPAGQYTPSRFGGLF